MIVNPDKCQTIVIKKSCRMNDFYNLNIHNQTNNSENFVKLLGIERGNILSFDKHISSLCKRARNELNAIGRIQKCMSLQEIEVLLNSLVLSNFNCCPIAWHFCSLKSLKKTEKIQERLLRILYNNSTSEYNQLLNKSNKGYMEVKCLRKLALEIFKSLNHLKPEYMKKIFHKTINLTHRPLNIKVNQNNTTR